jgi:hypothetical protein
MKTSKFLIKISSNKASTRFLNIFLKIIKSLNSSATIGKPPYPQKYLLDRALSPYIAKNPIDLSNHLSKNVIYHAVGDIIAVEKPYGGLYSFSICLTFICSFLFGLHTKRPRRIWAFS